MASRFWARVRFACWVLFVAVIVVAYLVLHGIYWYKVHKELVAKPHANYHAYYRCQTYNHSFLEMKPRPPSTSASYLYLPPLLTHKKRWWVAGWNARKFPDVTLDDPPPPVLRWSPRAMGVFREHWETVQHLHSSKGQPGGPCEGCRSRMVINWNWGLMSVVRDVGTIGLDLVMKGVPLVTVSPNFAEFANTTRPFCLPASNTSDVTIGCFWEPLAQCTVNPGMEPLVVEPFQDHITRLRIPFWSVLTDGDLVRWERTDGTPADPPPLFGQTDSAGDLAVQAMLRSIMVRVVWKPNAMVAEAVERLERSLHWDGPLLALHIRRTDKGIDKGIMVYRTRYDDGYVPYSEYGKMIAQVESETGISFRSVILLTDDLDAWSKRSEWLAGFSNKDVVPLLNPYWLEHERMFVSPAWKRTGHFILAMSGKEPTITSFHREMLADVHFAAEHASYLVGCGSSALSQFVAQGIGMRTLLDPAWMSLFEEDYFGATDTSQSVPERFDEKDVGATF